MSARKRKPQEKVIPRWWERVKTFYAVAPPVILIPITKIVITDWRGREHVVNVKRNLIMRYRHSDAITQQDRNEVRVHIKEFEEIDDLIHHCKSVCDRVMLKHQGDF